MNLATQLFSERIVAALGWTLFHSLWQGALAALAFAVLLYFTRRASARLRYGLGLLVLALTLLLSLLTFRTHYSAFGAVPTIELAGSADRADIGAGSIAAASARRWPSTARRVASFFSDYFGRHLPLIVTLWLLGVLFLSLRLTGSMLYLQRLKYVQSRPLPPPWPGRLQALAVRAGLRRPLRLLESLRLKTPVVVGHLKPVLLVPAGLVAGLPADEVEALLAHELAHVLRRDYLVNVLQNLVGIIFFFHPGVRWISSCVRREREHCCDDFAVALCGDARDYARALARLQAGGPRPEPALAALGRPQRMLRRIARLLARPRLTHDFREGFLSALLLVLGLLGMLKLATAAGGVPSAPVGAAPAVEAAPAEPGLPAAEAQTERRFALVSFVLEAEGLVRLVGREEAEAGGSPPAAGTWLVDESDGQVIWYMDLASRARESGGSFSEEVSLGRGAYSWYRPAGWKATMQWKRARGSNWEPLTMFADGRDHILRRHRADVELLKKKEEEERERLRAERAEQDRQRDLIEAEQEQKEEVLRKKEEELLALEGAERERKEEELKRLQQEMAIQEAARDRLREEEQRLRAEELRTRDLVRRKELEEKRLRLEAERLRREEARLGEEDQRLRDLERLARAEQERAKELEAQVKRFMAELVAAGLVEEGKKFEIKLSASSLVINGKKQPAAAHERIKKSYESLTGRKLDEKKSVTIVNNEN
ncbi:MAG: M48 family metalloprotease [Candidatus Aminicenantes bacterium]|nr:M48 family metalloprotease [Candidatus Aminicenantes bacterium]